MPDQTLREKSVKRKLNTIPLEFRNRNILLVDDSIVRGTTMKQIITMCRQAGAANVYVASAAPPVRHPNVYGIDMPAVTEFIANGKTIEQINEKVGSDRLFYQSLDDLVDSTGALNPDIAQFDTSCFDGVYVTGDIDAAYLQALHEARNDAAKSESREDDEVIDMHNDDE